VLLAERRKRFRRVVADGRESQPFVLKLFDPALQLDELRFAVRSPIGGPEEHQHGAPWSHDGLARPRFAVLIVEAEIGDELTDLRAEFGHVDRCVHGAALLRG
jgi:hypothetical protein